MSTDKQQDSPEVQAQILREWAQSIGVPIEIMVEQAVSAFTQDFDRRPVGKYLSRTLKEGDWLVATYWHRIMRSRTNWGPITRLRRRGVRVFTLRDGIADPDTPAGRLMESILGAVAEHESDQLSVRVRESNAWRRQQGLPTNGQPGYGRKFVRVERGIDPRKRAIFADRVLGRHCPKTGNILDPATGQRLDDSKGEADLYWIARAAYMRKYMGATCKYIAEWLNALGIKSPFFSRKLKDYLPWSRERVSRVTRWWWQREGVRPAKSAVLKQPYGRRGRKFTLPESCDGPPPPDEPA